VKRLLLNLDHFPEKILPRDMLISDNYNSRLATTEIPV